MIFDSSDLLKFLIERKIHEGLDYFWEEDETGRVSRIFAEVEGGKELFHRMDLCGCKVVL